ncbi:MAG TPA: undecaprenyl-diphosphate phosphatase [Abditibacteriaceae bacterium]
MEITWWQAIILGLVQGLTEFIPVSSSAHLNIVHWLLGQKRELTFDVMLHIGTLSALAWYFRHDWAGLLRDPAQKKLRNLVFLACVPAVLAGVALKKYQHTPIFANVQFNATMLIIMGGLLWWADHIGRKRRDLDHVNLKDALIIGVSQAMALVPGVSRSGATMTAGLFRRLTREAAARFSFLMSLPITLGAVSYEFYKDVYKAGGFAALDASPSVIALGIGTSAASGFWAIGFLLNFLKKHDVTLFVVWRIAVALAVFALLALGWKP